MSDKKAGSTVWAQLHSATAGHPAFPFAPGASGTLGTETARAPRRIRQALDLAQITCGTFRLHHLTTTAFHALVDQVLAALRAEPGLRADVSWVRRLEARHDLAAATDPETLGQALQHLFRAAAAFAPAGGVIALRSRNVPVTSGHLPEQGTLLLMIETAARPEDLESAGPRPFRSTGKPLRAFGRHNLSLMLARSIVELQGGALAAERTAGGIEITLRLSLKGAALFDH
jgi:signal transduction histidine kinase